MVSIHAPWEGCDLRIDFQIDVNKAFQFTHPGKGATSDQGLTDFKVLGVSIHAPWEGCD